MIGKIVAGSGAGGVVAYVTGKDGAELLSSTWSGPAELWAAQIDAHTQEMGSSVAQTVVHVSLAAAPGERLSDDQWRAVAEEYLQRMGWGEHDHAIVRHTDTSHDHVHIIIARVGRDGQTADLHNDFPRQERALDSIERDFSLTRTHEQIRIEAEKDPYRAIESATRSHLTFERSQVERYFERLGFERDKITELTDRAMSDERVLHAGDRFTTHEVRAEVRALDGALHQLAGQDARPTLDRGESARAGLDQGQRFAADQIAAGKGLVVVEGFAGAGKSTMLRAAAEDLRFSGHDVLGVAPSGKAAKGLEQSAGIESHTLTKTLIDIEKGNTKLTADSVVIVDEAGMARNEELGRLAQHVADAGGRLVLVGDERQLGAVGRGGGFAEAREIAGSGTARLDEIHRQREDWQRDATQAFGEGRARDAIQAYLDHGKVEWAASRGTARDMLVADYVRELERGTSPRDMLALAQENRDVRQMNTEIRAAIKERGGLQDARTYRLEHADGNSQKIEIAVGDRVVFERNNARTGEKNGEFGTVTKTDRRGFDVRMDDGRMQRVEDGGQHQMSHGYASSIHKSQGATVEKTYTLASKGMDSKLAYVSMSRQKDDTKLYANHAEFKNDAHLKNSLSRDGGREAFKNVVAAGSVREHGKESAASRAAVRDHRPAALTGEQRHEQRQGQEHGANPQQRQEKSEKIESGLVAAALDQGKIRSGLEQEKIGGREVAQDRGQEGGQEQSRGEQTRAQEPRQSQLWAGQQRQDGRGQLAQGQAKGAQQHKGAAQPGSGQAQGQGQGQAQSAGQKQAQKSQDHGQQAGKAQSSGPAKAVGAQAGKDHGPAVAAEGKETSAGAEKGALAGKGGKAQVPAGAAASSSAAQGQAKGAQASGKEKGQAQGKGKDSAKAEQSKAKSKGYGL